jgi:WD40 repeat protein
VPKLRHNTIRALHGVFAAAAEAWAVPAQPESLYRYGFRHGVAHLLARGESRRAEKLLTSFDYCMARLLSENGDGARPMAGDFASVLGGGGLENTQMFRIWEAFFRERAHILARGDENWQAHKILLQIAVEHADDSPLTQQAERWLQKGACDWFWLRNVRRVAHTIRNPCRLVLEGHSKAVKGALRLLNGNILSWPTDGIWARETRSHRGSIGDYALRVWDYNMGHCRATLDGHTESVTTATVLADGSIISGSDDTTLRVWDAETGTCCAVLEGHTDRLSGIIELPGGNVVSWSEDCTLRIWDMRSGSCDVLEGHREVINGTMLLRSGAILSWSADRTLRLWDPIAKRCQAVFRGHKGSIDGALQLASGCLLSWSADCTLRIWDAETTMCCKVLVGHTKPIEGALQLRNGDIVSWSNDRSLLVWDKATFACRGVLEGNNSLISGALALNSGEVLAWLWDNTLRIWDTESRQCRAVLKGHEESINGAMQLSSGTILSWSSDRTLRGWDPLTSTCCVVLEGHTEPVNGAIELADGSIISWSGNALSGSVRESGDNRLRVWDLSRPECILSIERHLWPAWGACGGTQLLESGHILSWSLDNTFRIWDRSTGYCLDVIPVDEEERQRPYRQARVRTHHPVLQGTSSEDWCVAISECGVALALKNSAFLAIWVGDCHCDIHTVFPDGTLVVPLADGHVFFLTLYCGSRRVTLDEAREFGSL